MPHRDGPGKDNKSKGLEAGPRRAEGSDEAMNVEDTIDAGDFSRDFARSPALLLRENEVVANTYHVRRLIGQGGMAQVFEAYDPLLRRAVAIKAAWPHVARGWLHSEARTLASLRHPALVTIHGMGTHRDIDYIVLERLYGLNLRTHLAQRQANRLFSIDEALDILIAIADALAYVHQNGLAHRDLKPNNIMLEGNRRVVLLDFGTVTSAHAPVEAMAGSPHYMAPEIIAGDDKGAHSPALDIYSLGIIAHEMLTGSWPFVGTSTTEILTNHLSEPIPELRNIRPEVPEQMARIIAEMLAKEPEARPGSANVIALWLRALQRGRTVDRGGRDLNVLITDDDPDMLHLVESCVEHAAPSARIRTAKDGLEAMKLFHDEPPDLLLFDIHMPRMTGVELCMYLVGTNLADKTTLVGISARATEEDRQLLKRLGVAEVLSKRIPATQLLSELMRLIRRVHDDRCALIQPTSDNQH